jgi:hypothetical protein
MTDLEQRLRRDLATAVRDQPVPVFPTGADYRAEARCRWPVVSIAAAAAAVLVIVVGGIGLLSARTPSGVPAAGGGPAAWPARGSLAADVGLTNAAKRAWEAAPLPAAELPHQDVHVLYAQRTISGDVVVLTGVDAKGHQRIAEFDTDATSTTVFRHRLHLVADLLAPSGDKAGLIAIDAPRHTSRKSDDDLLVILAAPGTPLFQWRDQATGWRSVRAANGAAALVHLQHNPLTTYVRAGNEGAGVTTMGQFFPFDVPMGQPIVHDLDPDEVVPPAAGGFATEICTRDSCSVSVGGGTLGATPSGPKGTWQNLLEDGPVRGPEWWEFGGEAQLYAKTMLPASGISFGPTWSSVLPDNTGIYLEHFTPGNDPTHLIAYVDRPEWSGGTIIDLAPRDGRLPALAVEVPTPQGRTLDVVLGDGLTAQWRAGTGPWHSMAAHHNVATSAVPGGVRLQWRVVDANGAVIASGTPHPAIAR